MCILPRNTTPLRKYVVPVFFKSVITLLSLFLSVYVCVCQRGGISSLPSSMWVVGTDLGYQNWQPAPLLDKPHLSRCIYKQNVTKHYAEKKHAMDMSVNIKCAF